jgi:hypothetical protein
MNSGIWIGLAVGSLVVIWTMQRRADRNRKSGTAVPSQAIKYYPGTPTGYAGFTDHTAMNCEVNDSLIGQKKEAQFRLVGFGEGFTQGMIERSKGKDGLPAIFLVQTTSDLDRQCIEWLVLMQEKGVDNAPPSSSNLNSIMKKISQELRESGPVTTKFWDKVRGQMEMKKTPDDDMGRLINIFYGGRERGLKLANEALIESP